MSNEGFERAEALFFDAIDTHFPDNECDGYFDRQYGTLDGNIDEVVPALLAYGWTPPNVDPLPRPERQVPEAPVETWTGPTVGVLNEGDVVTVNFPGGKPGGVFKVDKALGSSLHHGLTKLECTRVDGAEDISVELRETP